MGYNNQKIDFQKAAKHCLGLLDDLSMASSLRICFNSWYFVNLAGPWTLILLYGREIR